VDAAYRRQLRPGERVLLAVSGGADSSALLVASAHSEVLDRSRLEVAWVDHVLRPQSKREGERVAQLCRALEVPFRALRLKKRLRPDEAGLEAKARDARYEVLTEAMREAKAAWLATAHTADDQAETLLFRLARGTDLRGAGAIREASGGRLRPLLGCGRGELESFLRDLGLQWAQDAMNEDLRFTRVRLRKQALPSLSSAMGLEGSVVASHLAQFAARASEDDAWLWSQAQNAAARLALEDGALDGPGLRCLEVPLRRRVMVGFLEQAGLAVDAPTLERVLDALESGKAAPLSHRHHLECKEGRVRVVAARP
jgi:tRNA(Ile)-lysidine synthase